jgi:deoxyribodipyrimidine photo-lyase
MQIHRRFEYNQALEFAVAKANELNKPLLIYEALKCTYRWASARFHTFLLQGMLENLSIAKENQWNYLYFVEKEPWDGKGLVDSLCSKACLIVTDEFPAYVIRAHNQKVGPRSRVSYVSVDANGIIPIGLSAKGPYSAYEFRRLMQRNFVDAFRAAPQKSPLRKLKNLKRIELDLIAGKWIRRSAELKNSRQMAQHFPVDQTVPPVSIEGTRAAALKRMKEFCSKDLMNYAAERNHPDLNNSSRLSPYLHFGKVSAFEIVKAVLNKQPHAWDLNRIVYRNGSREGFWNGDPSIDSFLDQLITWRETGYHFCHHVSNYDQYDSLPDWARSTLNKHSRDKRRHIYNFEDFERSCTHDALWNAAQRQLVREGIIHNYLRMLWGKKILEWTPNPETALQYLIELNNKYSIDGRNPNSYTGICWILGRFDRPWAPERPVFGSVRYMSSENTARKVKVKQYLEKFKE